MTTPSDRAILTRRTDPLLTGGLSIVAVGLLLALRVPLSRLGAGAILALQALINWPHFVSSYAVLYRSPEVMRRHFWAAFGVPVALLGYAAFALAVARLMPIHVELLQWAAALYLGRHYTGQTWGMMATFGHLDGMTFTPRERRLIRSGLWLMMLWHMSWAAANVSVSLAPALAARCATLYARMTPVAFAALAAGALGLAMTSVRRHSAPPLRVWVPWVALHLWYVLLACDSAAALVAQLAHALQYLIFPLRIARNTSETPLPELAATRMLAWIIGGLVIFAGLPQLFATFYRDSGGVGDLHELVAAVVSSVVSVHHYFVDGSLYRLRNPEVRRVLFSHLSAAPASTPAAVATGTE
jgi:hypothetical protein